MSRPGSAGADDSRCPRCRAPVLRQWVGRVAALYVVADLTPIDPADEHQIREPNRLTWCLVTGRWRPTELRWHHRNHIPNCTHQIVAEHRCTTEPTTLF
ncbi:hypothetical protein [Streptomyces vinaceus]|uniref:hypothetical protein n=1 Tax=Streptomyces vinaceus TaxID=1960 RepID=UPI0036D033C2